MYQLIGSLIIVGYAGILALVHLGIKHQGDGFNEIIFMGKKVPCYLLAPSIFCSWVWPTSIIGAAEAGIRYGLSGGIAYALGAGIGFAMLTLIIVRFQRLMPNTPFISEFIGKRFSPRTKTIFFILITAIAIYIIVEMSVGIGFVLSGLFGISFKIVTFLSVVIAMIFILTTGIRGLIYNDLINFFIIAILFGTVATLVLHKFDVDFIYQGLLEVKTNPANSNYNPEVFNYFAAGGVRYFISAIIVGFAQTCVDPSYSLRAHIALNEKSFVKSFVLGGVILFMPAAALSSIVLGYTALALNFELGEHVNLSIILSSKMFLDQFPLWISIIFAFAMFAITMTTILSSLMGLLGISSTNIYTERFNPKASNKEKLIFGRTFTASIGLICALIGISLENVSLLTLDTFCGILFAAPAGVLLVGLFSKKKFGDYSLFAISLGAVSGFILWLRYIESGTSWFYGTLLSFFAPIVFLWLVGLIKKEQFNMHSLKW